MAEEKEREQPNGQEVLEPEEDDGYRVGYCQPPREHMFKKGNRANPGGRVKNPETSMVKILLHRLGEVIGQEEPKPYITHADEIVDNLLAMAKAEGPAAMKAIEMIFNRSDGPVRTEISGPGGDPLFLPKAFIGIDPELVAQGTLQLASSSSLGAA